jgi:hypothetical protein
MVRERDGREEKKGKKLLATIICWIEVDHNGKGREGIEERKRYKRAPTSALIHGRELVSEPSESQMEWW